MTDTERVITERSGLRARDVKTRRWDQFLYGAIAVSALLILVRWVTYFRRDEVVPPYKMTLLWVDYRDGFVRRGLPGEVFSWISDQHTTTTATVFGVVLSALGALSLCCLTRMLVRRGDALPVVALLSVSPLALPLVLRDLGRYDAVTLAALVVVAALLSGRRRFGLPVVAGLLVVVTAVEEFAVMLAAPVVVLSIARWGAGRLRHRVVVAGAVLAPSAVLAGISVLVHPPMAALTARAEQAHRAGVTLPSITGDDAASMLAASAAQQVATFTRYSSLALLATGIGAAGLALISGYLLWLLVGRPAPKLALWSGTWFAGSALALSILGVDFLRWWSLGFLAFAAVLVVLPAGDVTARRGAPGWLLIGVLLLSLLAADFPIEPLRLTG